MYPEVTTSHFLQNNVILIVVSRYIILFKCAMKNEQLKKNISKNYFKTFCLFFRADCSNVDKPGGIPEHNGLSKFGKVKKSEIYLSKLLGYFPIES
jgi:hypothetical protein